MNNRCAVCNGRPYMDEGELRCLNCGRPLNPVAPLPLPENPRLRHKNQPVASKAVPVRVPSVGAMRDRKRGRAR